MKAKWMEDLVNKGLVQKVFKAGREIKISFAQERELTAQIEQFSVMVRFLEPPIAVNDSEF